MHYARSAAFLALAALGTAASACGPNAPHGTMMADPRGTDATFNFTWRINGRDPAGADDPCAAANVRFIRMVVVDAQNVSHAYDEFRYDCHLGAHRSSRPELAAGTFQFYWEAVAPDGTRQSLASGVLDASGHVNPAPEMVTLAVGQHWDFDLENRPDATTPGAPTNFATGTGPFALELTFASAPGASMGVSCSAAMVGDIDWTLHMSNRVLVPMTVSSGSCAAGFGTVRWDALNYDNFSIDVRGHDASGVVRWQGTCGNLLVSPGAPAHASCLVDKLP